MDTQLYPNEQLAASIVMSMTGEHVLSSTRFTTGDQHFVFAIKTENKEFVLRMTNAKNKSHFISAIYWQEKLIPLGIPLAKFIQSDLKNEFSPFPALLMKRLPGDDLCNVYSSLTNLEKENLAKEMVSIQNKIKALPNGLGFGMASNYENLSEFKSWYDFLMQRLKLLIASIKKSTIFDATAMLNVISIANELKEDFYNITATPFLWDASERNVLVYKGKISGIVDIDEICFGDPLFALGLTYSALKNEGHDTLYTDYWAENLNLDQKAKLRLEFYRLFYIVVFMRKHSMLSANNQRIIFDPDRLKDMFSQSLAQLKELLK